MIVTFETLAGTTGQVTIPMSQYTVPNIEAIINAQADAIDKVNALTGSQPSLSSGGSAGSS